MSERMPGLVPRWTANQTLGPRRAQDRPQHGVLSKGNVMAEGARSLVRVQAGPLVSPGVRRVERAWRCGARSGGGGPRHVNSIPGEALAASATAPPCLLGSAALELRVPCAVRHGAPVTHRSASASIVRSPEPPSGVWPERSRAKRGPRLCRAPGGHTPLMPCETPLPPSPEPPIPGPDPLPPPEPLPPDEPDPIPSPVI